MNGTDPTQWGCVMGEFSPHQTVSTIMLSIIKRPLAALTALDLFHALALLSDMNTRIIEDNRSRGRRT